jgi:hypothetical protein
MGRIGKKFELGCISVKTTIEKARDGQDEWGRLIREELEAMRRHDLEELEAKAKKAKKKYVPPELPLPRLTPLMVQNIYQRELSQVKYANKGFVLDGYPKSFDDACHLFLSTWL